MSELGVKDKFDPKATSYLSDVVDFVIRCIHGDPNEHEAIEEARRWVAKRNLSPKEVSYLVDLGIANLSDGKQGPFEPMVSAETEIVLEGIDAIVVTGGTGPNQVDRVFMTKFIFEPRVRV